MPESDFSNRELTTMFAHIQIQLVDIKAQTTKTNGRVNRLERNLMIMAAILATTTVIKFPEVLGVVKLFI